MKKPYFLLVGAVLAFSCGKKDKFLFSQVSNELIVNPDTKVIVKDNIILNVSNDSSGVIHGLTDKNAFNSSNQFQSFSYVGYSMTASISQPVYDKNKVVVATGTALAPMVHYSTDYGVTWDSLPPAFTPALTTPPGYYATELASVNYMDKQNLIMVYIQKAYTNIHVKQVYKVNIASKQGTLISSWSDVYIPVSVQFADDTTGYMLIYRSSVNGTYISKTKNGGVKWTTPKVIDTKNMSLMQVGNKNNLVVYEPNGSVFYSGDSAATWKKANNSVAFNTLHMVSPALSFAIANSGLMKSTDSGSTWNAVTASAAYEFPAMKKVYFNDEQNGVMYADQKLFVTSDGGATWKTLLYPYDYIIQ
jgi:hypothetical protein